MDASHHLNQLDRRNGREEVHAYETLLVDHLQRDVSDGQDGSVADVGDLTGAHLFKLGLKLGKQILLGHKIIRNGLNDKVDTAHVTTVQRELDVRKQDLLL